MTGWKLVFRDVYQWITLLSRRIPFQFHEDFIQSRRGNLITHHTWAATLIKVTEKV